MSVKTLRAQASCFIAAFGCTWPPRHERTSRVLEVGASGILDVFKSSGRPLLAAVKGLNTREHS